jgi:hypothetical protein
MIWIMNLHQLRKSVFWSVTVACLLLASGSFAQSERKMARTFTTVEKPAKILFLLPDYIYKFNLKTRFLRNISYSSQQEKEALLWKHSLFIQYLSDSIFKTRLEKGYRDELKTFGIQLYGADNTAQFFSQGGKGFVVNIAQTELDEDNYLYSDTAFVESQTYVFRKYLNALDVNLWFEISKVNAAKDDTSAHQMLFVENLLTDQLDGGFQLDETREKFTYPFRIDSLTLKKIYDFTEDLGRTYADYTFDYLLNRYLDWHMPKGKRTERYWRYDPYRKHLFIATDDRFIPLR